MVGILEKLRGMIDWLMYVKLRGCWPYIYSHTYQQRLLSKTSRWGVFHEVHVNEPCPFFLHYSIIAEFSSTNNKDSLFNVNLHG